MSFRIIFVVIAINIVVCYEYVESISVSAKRQGNALEALQDRKRDENSNDNKRDNNGARGGTRTVANKGDLVTFKQDSDRDSSASESSNSRGYPGYYGSNPNSEYGYVAYEGGVGYYGDKGSGEVYGHGNGHSFGHEAHSLDHHHGHYSGGNFDHHDYGDHGDHGHQGHGHQDHGITLKGFLLPIAGLALLGAAAALVSNPILLQLGVVSGRRRRRSIGSLGIMQNQPPSVSDFILRNTQIDSKVMADDGSNRRYYVENFRSKKDLKNETHDNVAQTMAYKGQLVKQ